MKANDNTDNEVKKTRIDADSEIYNKNRSDKLEDGQFKEMSTKEKLIYFKEYYLTYTLVILAMVLALVYVVTSIRKTDAKKDTFYCAMIDGLQLDEDTMDALPAEFTDYLKNETDYDGYINAKATYFETFYATFTDDIRIDGFFDKQKFDVLILRDKAFKNYCAGKTLVDLSTILPEDLLQKLESRLIYVVDQETGATTPYGILLDNLDYKFQDGAGDAVDPPILAIPVCTTRTEVAIHFIEFFISEQIKCILKAPGKNLFFKQILPGAFLIYLSKIIISK